MRKIEQWMLEKIQAAKNVYASNKECPNSTEDFSAVKDNTIVTLAAGSNLIEVFLWGNRIAEIDCISNAVFIDGKTLDKYPTLTTKSRLRALGCKL